MKQTKPEVNLHQLARVGAAARLAELEQEIAALKRAFPGLTVLSVDVVEGKSAAKAVVRKVAADLASQPAPKRGRKSPMSKAERKAVSLRMKQYWAARKKTKTDKKNA